MGYAPGRGAAPDSGALRHLRRHSGGAAQPDPLRCWRSMLTGRCYWPLGRINVLQWNKANQLPTRPTDDETSDDDERQQPPVVPARHSATCQSGGGREAGMC